MHILFLGDPLPMGDIRPKRPSGPMFGFLAWSRNSILYATGDIFVEPPQLWQGLVPPRPEGQVAGQSVLIYNIDSLERGVIPVLIDDRIVGRVPAGTPPGRSTEDVVGRILDEEWLLYWQDPRLPEAERDSAKYAHCLRLLEMINTQGARCTPVWSSFHWPMTTCRVRRVFALAIRFSIPRS